MNIRRPEDFSGFFSVHFLRKAVSRYPVFLQSHSRCIRVKASLNRGGCKDGCFADSCFLPISSEFLPYCDNDSQVE